MYCWKFIVIIYCKLFQINKTKEIEKNSKCAFLIFAFIYQCQVSRILQPIYTATKVRSRPSESILVNSIQNYISVRVFCVTLNPTMTNLLVSQLTADITSLLQISSLSQNPQWADVEFCAVSNKVKIRVLSTKHLVKSKQLREIGFIWVKIIVFNIAGMPVNAMILLEIIKS